MTTTIERFNEKARALGMDPDALRAASCEPDGKPWMTHQEFLDDDARAVTTLRQRGSRGRFSFRELAEQAEQRRRKAYVDAHEGSDDGYEPEPPCEGMMMIPEHEAANLELATLGAECDACGFRIGLKRDAFDPHYVTRKMLSRAGLPAKFQGRRMEPMAGQREARSAFRDYVGTWNQPSGEDGDGPPFRLPVPMLYGAPGRGKSHLICSVAETLIRKHSTDTVYWSFAELLNKVKQGFGDNVDESIKTMSAQVWERAKTVELLVLDDIGAERPTEWAREQFQLLVDYRYSSELPILIASNVPPAQWDDIFGARTSSRLKGMTLPFEVLGNDLRQEPVVNPQTGEVIAG